MRDDRKRERIEASFVNNAFFCFCARSFCG